DNAKFIPTPEEEGIYYLRNKYSGKYMTYNSSSSKCFQNDYSGNINQAWIMKYDAATQKYIMQNGSGSAYGMKTGTTISGNYKYVTEGNSTNFSSIFIVVNVDGSYTIKQYINGYEYALDTYSNYTAWAPYNQSSNSQKWYMESLQWRRGDVNMDGIINSTDANIVQQHINYTNPITVNINKFLADASLNHVIDTTDVVLINNSSC
ncbi:MAG: dockerin type I repeat-containing protein, partial [Oscillospiraceae bacterium]|nr:dockerin type I repeat-containing protein [Oscillospiraceae bacterium]